MVSIFSFLSRNICDSFEMNNACIMLLLAGYFVDNTNKGQSSLAVGGIAANWEF